MRETVYAALWSLILNAPGIRGMFNTTGRLLRHLEDVSTSEMPALFLLQNGETWTRTGKGIPAKRTLNATLLFYVSQVSGDDGVPATLLNNAMDVIDGLFNVGTQVQTLGGLVEHAYIADGEIRYYEGLLQDKSPATVPLKILVP